MISTLLNEWQQLGLMNWATNAYGWILEDGRHIGFSDWQQAVLIEYCQRKADVSTLFVSTVKKTGKTTISSLIVAYRWLTIPSVHFVVANDQSQAEELQFNIIATMIKRHPILKRYSKITKDTITFTPTGSRIVSLPMDAAGAAGANFATVSFSELWGYFYEQGERLFSELTPIPGDCLRIIDSYAGYTSESELLERVWNRAKAGNRINDDWPIFQDGRQLAYIHQGEDAQIRCWRGDEESRKAYYEEQKKPPTRPGDFRRLHLNEWASSEDVFITEAQWDALINHSYRLDNPNKSIRLHISCDIGTKHDHSAVTSIFWRDKQLWLGPCRFWIPPVGKEVDLESVEDYLIQLFEGYGCASMSGDPSQFVYMKQRLQKAKIPVVEFIQSPANLTRAGNTLFSIIREGRLNVYPGATELRTYVLNSKAKESDRGIRLIKQQQRRKIDGAITLAMAIADAMETKPQWRDIPFLSVSTAEPSTPAKTNQCPVCRSKNIRQYAMFRDCAHCGKIL